MLNRTPAIQAAGQGRPWVPPPDYVTPKPERAYPGLSRKLLEFLGIIIGAILVAYALQALLVKPFQIPSESMEPTLRPGDRILVNRLAYRFSEPQRGDVVVFKFPRVPEVDFVKRIIAVAGDTIEVRQGVVLINGEPQTESYINMAGGRDVSNFAPQTVPPGNVFVMGDNRTNSQDGRYWNPPWLPVENIVGKAFFTYWPPQRLTRIG